MAKQKTFGFDSIKAESVRRLTTVPANELIRASAGTGKTHQLSSRYLRLVAAGQPIDHILATTFTRKAAGEIFERVIQRLVAASCSPSSREQLARDIAADALTAEDCRSLLSQVTRRLHRIQISTIDSFFGRVARSLSFEIGLSADWQMADSQQDAVLREKALARTLAGHDIGVLYDLMLDITEGQAKREIMTTMMGAIDEVYDLYTATLPDGDAAWTSIGACQPVSEDQWEAVTSRFAAIPIEKASMKKAHATALDRLQQRDATGFSGKGIAAKILDGQDMYNRCPIPDDLRAVYVAALETFTQDQLGALSRRTRAARDLAESFHREYELAKSNDHVAVFDDIPLKLRQLVTSGLTEQLVFRLDSRIDHLLLDEFQDTSAMQWDCFRQFAQQTTDQQNSNASLFCVGDTKQAIYGWRGGHAEILSTLPQRLNNVVERPLSKSYRSCPAVIDVVNRVFGNLTAHRHLDNYEEAVQQWTFPEHSTERTDMPGYVALSVAGDDQEDDKPDPLLDAAKLAEVLHQSSPHHEIGILLRSNKERSEMNTRLRQLGLFASDEGASPITDSAAVQQMMSLIELADYPSNCIAAFHVAHGPLAAAYDFEWSESDGFSQRDANRLARLVRRQLLDEGYGPCTQQWANRLEPLCSDREWARLRQLVDVAYEYQSQSTLRPSDFCRFVEMQSVSDPNSANVRVMVIHQAKGLEFDTVILPFNRGSFFQPPKLAVEFDHQTFRPAKIIRYASKELRPMLPQEIQRVYQADTARRVEESLCIWYVAMTRAKHALHMIVPPARTRHTKDFAGILCATLAGDADRSPGQQLFTAGNPLWYRDLMSTDQAVQSARPKLTLRLKPSDKTSAVREAPSPSKRAIHQSSNSPALFSSSNDRALQVGTLWHAWLESLEWLDDGALPSPAMLDQIRRGVGDFQHRPSELIDEFLHCLRQPTIAHLLNRHHYARSAAEWLEEQHIANVDRAQLEFAVHNERRVAIEDETGFAIGEIDRLVLMSVDGQLIAAEVIDYKSNHANSTDERLSLVEGYRPQLLAYRTAVAKTLGLEPKVIRARLVFLRLDHAADV